MNDACVSQPTLAWNEFVQQVGGLLQGVRIDGDLYAAL